MIPLFAFVANLTKGWTFLRLVHLSTPTTIFVIFFFFAFSPCSSRFSGWFLWVVFHIVHFSVILIHNNILRLVFSNLRWLAHFNCSLQILLFFSQKTFPNFVTSDTTHNTNTNYRIMQFYKLTVSCKFAQSRDVSIDSFGRSLCHRVEHMPPLSYILLRRTIFLELLDHDICLHLVFVAETECIKDFQRLFTCNC